MKSHTSEFKEEIKTLGKQQSVRITYTLNNEQIILTDEDINSATPNYEASLLKSVMKVLELDSNVSIPKGTEIKFEYGLLVNGAYEYLDYGNYIVAKEPEKQEDTLSYKIICYDKMLYSMKDYEHIEITYPCTIKQYLVALCNKIGLQFKDSDFANASRQITNELFMTINEDGTYSSMGYTYRDVLDQIAEVTGGCICITLDNKVEVRYINDLTKTKTKSGNTIYIDDGIEEKLSIDKIKGGYKQETRQGYNLFNNNSQFFPSSFPGLKLSFKDDGSIILKGTATGTWNRKRNKGNIYNIEAGTYTLYLKVEGNCTNAVLNFAIEDSSMKTITSARIGVSNSSLIKVATFTYDGVTEIKYTSILLEGIRTNTDYDCVFYPMLLKNTYTVDVEYEQYGASPSPEFPSAIETVSDDVEINVTNNDNTKSQTAIMPIQQELLNGDYIADVEHHEWGKIESYNGETITTDYISTTGELTTGATVYYKLVIPVDLELTQEQKTVKNQKLYTYQGTTNISIDNELASVDITYMTEKEQIDEEYISDINVNFGEKYRAD